MCLQRVTTQNENIVKYMSILIFEKLVDLFCRTFLRFLAMLIMSICCDTI